MFSPALTAEIYFRQNGTIFKKPLKDLITNLLIDDLNDTYIPDVAPIAADQKGSTCGLKSMEIGFQYLGGETKPRARKSDDPDLASSGQQSLRELAKKNNLSEMGEVLDVNYFSQLAEQAGSKKEVHSAITFEKTSPDYEEYLASIKTKLNDNTVILSMGSDLTYFPALSSADSYPHWCLAWGYMKINNQDYFLVTQAGKYYALSALELYKSHQLLMEKETWYEKEWIKTDAVDAEGNTIKQYIPATRFAKTQGNHTKYKEISIPDADINKFAFTGFTIPAPDVKSNALYLERFLQCLLKKQSGIDKLNEAMQWLVYIKIDDISVEYQNKILHAIFSEFDNPQILLGSLENKGLIFAPEAKSDYIRIQEHLYLDKEASHPPDISENLSLKDLNSIIIKYKKLNSQKELPAFIVNHMKSIEINAQFWQEIITNDCHELLVKLFPKIDGFFQIYNDKSGIVLDSKILTQSYHLFNESQKTLVRFHNENCKQALMDLSTSESCPNVIKRQLQNQPGTHPLKWIQLYEQISKNIAVKEKKSIGFFNKKTTNRAIEYENDKIRQYNQLNKTNPVILSEVLKKPEPASRISLSNK